MAGVGVHGRGDVVDVEHRPLYAAAVLLHPAGDLGIDLTDLVMPAIQHRGGGGDGGDGFKLHVLAIGKAARDDAADLDIDLPLTKALVVIDSHQALLLRHLALRAQLSEGLPHFLPQLSLLLIAGDHPAQGCHLHGGKDFLFHMKQRHILLLS